MGSWGPAGRLESPPPPDGRQAKVPQVLVCQVWHNVQGDLLIHDLLSDIGEAVVVEEVGEVGGDDGGGHGQPQAHQEKPHSSHGLLETADGMLSRKYTK